MQIFLIILINVLMGALFYVIITLKLEKSASEFRSKKLRKEVDEIIREFNETAERNITLLENKIAILKKLIESSDNLKGIDILLKDTDEDFEQSNVKKTKKSKKSKNKSNLPPPNDEIKQLTQKSTKQSFINIIAKIAKLVSKRLDLNSFNISLNNVNSKSLDTANNEGKKERKGKDRVQNIPVKGNYPIAKNFEEIFNEPIEIENQVIPNEYEVRDKIEKRSAECDNKFLLINQLISDGFSAEEISKYSGIPEGEVKLVLNLSR